MLENFPAGPGPENFKDDLTSLIEVYIIVIIIVVYCIYFVSYTAYYVLYFIQRILTHISCINSILWFIGNCVFIQGCQG